MSAFGQIHKLTILQRDVNQDVKIMDTLALQLKTGNPRRKSGPNIVPIMSLHPPRTTAIANGSASPLY